MHFSSIRLKQNAVVSFTSIRIYIYMFLVEQRELENKNMFRIGSARDSGRREKRKECAFCTYSLLCPMDLRRNQSHSGLCVKFAGEINVNVHELRWLLKYWNSAMVWQQQKFLSTFFGYSLLIPDAMGLKCQLKFATRISAELKRETRNDEQKKTYSSREWNWGTDERWTEKGKWNKTKTKSSAADVNRIIKNLIGWSSWAGIYLMQRRKTINATKANARVAITSGMPFFSSFCFVFIAKPTRKQKNNVLTDEW